MTNLDFLWTSGSGCTTGMVADCNIKQLVELTLWPRTSRYTAASFRALRSLESRLSFSACDTCEA